MNTEDKAQTNRERGRKHTTLGDASFVPEMNTTTAPPHPAGGDVALTYVLLPFFIITFAGIIVAAVMYVKRRQRIDRLRHQLLPVYTYDPTEELNEAEQELWKEDDTKGWTTTYQQRWPLLRKDPNA